MSSVKPAPWKAAFPGAHITQQVTVTADDAPPVDKIQLSGVDSNAFLMGIYANMAVAYATPLDFDRLVQASKKLLVRYPFFAGRARTDAQHLEIALTNEGFPLTAVTWPDGSLDDFPAAADAKGFDAKLPVQAEMPIFADDITCEDAILGRAPLFALRLTTFGRGGFHHMLGDGSRLCNSLADLGRAYQGQELQPLGRWLQRDLMSPENFHRLLPGGKELVDQAREAVKDVPPLPAGKTYRQILEETILKPGRDVESWAWGAHPEMPKGLSRQAIVFLHLPKSELAQLKQAVLAHSKETGGDVPAMISSNDIVFSVLWCLRCIFANAPLPGQAGIVRPELGLCVLDLAFNSLKGPDMEGFYGNGSAVVPVPVPPTAPIVENGHASEAGSKPEPDYSRDALLQAAGIVASGLRAGITDFRDPHGAGIQELLKAQCSPQRPYEECAKLKGVACSGQVTLRATMTSWERFPWNQVIFDRDEGPPKHIIPWIRVQSDAQSVLVPTMDSSACMLYMTVPATKKSAALEHIRKLLPSARYL